MPECPNCADEVDELHEEFPTPDGVESVCTECLLAAKVLAYSRPSPPFVDIGLYQEVVFYARQLAAFHYDREPVDVLDLSDENNSEAEA